MIYHCIKGQIFFQLFKLILRQLVVKKIGCVFDDFAYCSGLASCGGGPLWG